MRKLLEKIFVREKEYYNYIDEAFGLIAPFYDIIELFIRNIRQRAIYLSDIKSQDVICDFCSGTGTMAIMIANLSSYITGIDISSAMLRIAKRKDREGRVRFIKTDATKTPFQDNEFDISYISFGLHDMPQDIREQVLKEMKRVTKGKIVIIDYHIPKNPILKKLYTFIISIYETKYFRDFAKRDLESILNQKGFKILAKYPGFWNIYKIYICRK